MIVVSHLDYFRSDKADKFKKKGPDITNKRVHFRTLYAEISNFSGPSNTHYLKGSGNNYFRIRFLKRSIT